MLYDNEEETLEQMEEWKTKRQKNFSTVVNKRKISKFEMDDYFTGG